MLVRRSEPPRLPVLRRSTNLQAVDALSLVDMRGYDIAKIVPEFRTNPAVQVADTLSLVDVQQYSFGASIRDLQCH